MHGYRKSRGGLPPERGTHKRSPLIGRLNGQIRTVVIHTLRCDNVILSTRKRGARVERGKLDLGECSLRCVPADMRRHMHARILALEAPKS